MTRPEDIPAEIWEQADILKDQLRQYEDDLEYTARLLMWLKQDEQPQQLGLTIPQDQTLTFIADYQQKNGASPSYSDIAKGLGLSSKGQVHALIHQLKDRGAIQMAPRARSITIVARN